MYTLGKSFNIIRHIYTQTVVGFARVYILLVCCLRTTSDLTPYLNEN